MNFFRSLIVLTLTLTISACGLAGNDPAGSEGIYIYSAPGPINGTYDGYTTVHASGRSDILISAYLAGERATRVTMHELWHAVGYLHHSPFGCISHQTTSQSGPPCALEVEQMARLTRTYTIYVQDEALRLHAQAAALRWNQAVGRGLFAIGN